MILTSNVQRAIRETIEHRLPDVSFEDSAIAIPNRPCFRLNYITGNTVQSTTKIETKKCSFELVYFGDDAVGNAGLINVQEQLENILKEPVETLVDDNAVSFDIGNITYRLNYTDGFLTTVIDIEYEQEISEDIRNNAHSRFNKAVNTNTETVEEIYGIGD